VKTPQSAYPIITVSKRKSTEDISESGNPLTKSQTELQINLTRDNPYMSHISPLDEGTNERSGQQNVETRFNEQDLSDSTHPIGD
jgi:hypothetical protein